LQCGYLLPLLAKTDYEKRLKEKIMGKLTGIIDEPATLLKKVFKLLSTFLDLRVQVP